MRGWPLRHHLDPSLTWTAWRRALAHHPPELHHADQGVPYVATASLQMRPAFGVQIRLAPVGEATENGDAARLMRTLTAEDVTLHDDSDVHDAYQHLGRFLDDGSQQKRRHSAVGDFTPAVCETQWWQPPCTVPVTGETP